MKAKVFFSWQSDTPPESGRALLQTALEIAIARLATDLDLVVRPELDHDTKGIPGSPPIASAILAKLDECSILVSDVTLTYSRIVGSPARLAPNPNVLLETGYALKRLGHERVLLLMNTEAESPEQLPFDLRGSRIIPYARMSAEQLAPLLFEALKAIITTVGVPSDVASKAVLHLKKHNKVIDYSVHEYQLVVDVENKSDEILTAWSVELTFPSGPLLPNHNYPTVRTQDSGRVSVMRAQAETMGGALYPDERRRAFDISYRMTNDLYSARATLFKIPVVASLYHGTKRIAQESVLFGSIQEF